jgi:MFS family permease
VAPPDRAAAHAISGQRYALLVALMIAFSTMSYFDRIIMSIAGPGILNEFRLSPTQIGWIYSAFTLSYAALMIPGGALADRFGPRRVLFATGVGAALSTALTALAGSPRLGQWIGFFASFLIVRLALGIWTAPLYPTCARINLTIIPPRWRARVWGGVAAGSGIGGAISPLVFTFLIARFGWRAGFGISGILTVLLAIAWWFSTRGMFDHPGYAPRTSGRERPVRLVTRDLLLLTAAYGATNYFEYIFFYWLYYYFSVVQHTGAEQSAIYTTTVWLAWAVMTPLGGWISDHLVHAFGGTRGRRIIATTALSLSAILLFLSTSRQSSVAMVSLLCLALGCAAATDGAYWVAAGEAGGSRPAAATGIMNAGGSLGGLLAPVLTPYIAERSGWHAALYTGCVIVLAGVALWQFIGLEHDSAPLSKEVIVSPSGVGSS